MKKTFIFITLLFISTFLWCQNVEFKKIKQFKNDKASVYIREEVNPQDDITGNDIFFDADGNFMIYQRDKKLMLFTNKDLEIETQIKINTDTSLQTFQTIENNIFMGNHTEAFYFNKNGSEFFRVNIYSILNKLNGGDSNWFTDCYYDEEKDILFFTYPHNSVNSIVNPSFDEVQNQKNFRNAEETSKLLKNGNYAPHLTLDSDNDLYIDGVRCRWNATAYETTDYVITLNNKRKTIRVFDRKESEVLNYTIPENETEESITYHPNGDWYFLTINWTTDTHTLWRIENTWDSQWREQWNKEHINFDNQDSASSTNVAVSKVMTCNDNLRLRSQEATSSSVITTMQKGTKVKILKLGKAETIDGISSNWVQVEVLSGAKDKDSKEIKSGTTGWCYGGYLD